MYIYIICVCKWGDRGWVRRKGCFGVCVCERERRPLCLSSRKKERRLGQACNRIITGKMMPPLSIDDADSLLFFLSSLLTSNETVVDGRAVMIWSVRDKAAKYTCIYISQSGSSQESYIMILPEPIHSFFILSKWLHLLGKHERKLHMCVSINQRILLLLTSSEHWGGQESGG